MAVPLEERTALANNNKAELLVSVHANASMRPETRGAVVYSLSAEAAGSQQVPASESVPALGGGSRVIDVILWDIAQIRFLAESAAFAEMIGQELESRVPIGPRRIEQAPFRVLVGANMPAALVEIGFLSNPEQEQQLVSPAYQGLIVQGLVEAITRFRTHLEHSRGPGGGGRAALRPRPRDVAMIVRLRFPRGARWVMLAVAGGLLVVLLFLVAPRP